MVQQLELHASTTRGTGAISGWGTQILHATWCSQEEKKKKKNTRNRTLRLIGWREESEVNPMSPEACDQVQNLGGPWACGEF